MARGSVSNDKSRAILLDSGSSQRCIRIRVQGNIFVQHGVRCERRGCRGCFWDRLRRSISGQCVWPRHCHGIYLQLICSEQVDLRGELQRSVGCVAGRVAVALAGQSGWICVRRVSLLEFIFTMYASIKLAHGGKPLRSAGGPACRPSFHIGWQSGWIVVHRCTAFGAW